MIPLLLRLYFVNTPQLCCGYIYSTVIWCIYIFQTYVIFNAIGLTVPLHAVVVVKVVTVVAGFLSITPGAV